MNWFDTSGLTSLAKNALKEAQKTIDKALDIQDEEEDEQENTSPSDSGSQASPNTSKTPQRDGSDFFSSWGLTVSAESAKDEDLTEKPVVTESPSKATSQSVWGSFAGSFFEQPKDGSIVQPPKAKSMNVISDKYDSQDDLFSKSQLVMSADFSGTKDEQRRGSSRSNQLSLVSSRNSSDSVEVLSQSMKTTPDSEVSVQTMSHSSSFGPKMSESVEILPDSLVSPSSIECLGFDSCSEKDSSSLTASISGKITTPNEKTEKIGTVDTADSVSIVQDDDEDTISYNSISECTAPTVLDTDEKVSPYTKLHRIEPQRKFDKESVILEPMLLQKMQLSENSSDGGSWSDRTLNADELIEEKKEEHEDVLIEKLSDSSSFYNVNVASEMIRSESAVFVEIQHHQHNDGSESSQKDVTLKERVSPISSDSKSESLVKIGSDRTSGHTSGDEIETATSSDIEIIPSPNGDSNFRSPAKYIKPSKLDGTISPNLVDLVLGKSLASKIRGHNRELSEVSIQSNTSDESGSENDRLMRRLCEMAEVLEARENRLMEVSRSNAELVESNADLKSQVESLLAKHEGGEISLITEDYTQRMSALEKKFQQAIREKDQLRKQLDSFKAESSRKNSSELENSLKEKDNIIAQLQEEGEKLSRQQLQHSNIIKKLRVKEKDNEQVIKGLRDKISELSSELDRVKRAMAAKEEAEVNQIEAVYRLTTANKKLEAELNETKSALDDTTQRLESTRTSLEAARKELTELQRTSSELQRKRGAHARVESERDRLDNECDRLRAEVAQLRSEIVQEQKRFIAREESLRREVGEAREVIASLETSHTDADSERTAGLLAQLTALQRAALMREQAHANTTSALATQLADAETSLAKLTERERVARDEGHALQDALSASQGLLRDTRNTLEAVTKQCHSAMDQKHGLEQQLASKTQELECVKEEYETKLCEITARLKETEQLLAADRDALDIERKRNVILQERLCSRGDISPPHSVASDSLSGSLWAPDEGFTNTTPTPTSALCMEETLSLLTRREGEIRSLAAQVTQLRNQRDMARRHLAAAQHELDELKTVQEQYDALLQMYGEKEEQLQEIRLDLDDVTALYKQQLNELVALRQAAAAAHAHAHAHAQAHRK